MQYYCKTSIGYLRKKLKKFILIAEENCPAKLVQIYQLIYQQIQNLKRKDSRGLVGSFKRTMPWTNSLLTGCSHHMCPAAAATWTLSTHQAEGSSNITLTACQAKSRRPTRKKVTKVTRKHTSLPVIKNTLNDSFPSSGALQTPLSSDSFKKHMSTHMHKVQLFLTSHARGVFFNSPWNVTKPRFKRITGNEPCHLQFCRTAIQMFC